MRRPAWCGSCGKAFQARSRKQLECPTCTGGIEPEESGEAQALPERHEEPVEGSLVTAPELGLLRFAAGVPDEERECPRCAEKIKARAKVCRFCQADLVADSKADEAERARLAYLASDDGRAAEYAKKLETSRSITVPRGRVSRDRERASGPPPGWEYAIRPKAWSLWWWVTVAVVLLSLGVWAWEQHVKAERAEVLRAILRQAEIEDRAWEMRRERERAEADEAARAARESLERKMEAVEDRDRNERLGGG